MRSDPSNVAIFPANGVKPLQVGFERKELDRILNLYGRMVAAGHWRDYAMDMGKDAGIFAAFRRASGRPQIGIEKRPANRDRQGMWTLHGEDGVVLKRGHEVAGILAPMERKLM